MAPLNSENCFLSCLRPGDAPVTLPVPGVQPARPWAGDPTSEAARTGASVHNTQEQQVCSHPALRTALQGHHDDFHYLSVLGTSDEAEASPRERTAQTTPYIHHPSDPDPDPALALGAAAQRPALHAGTCSYQDARLSARGDSRTAVRVGCRDS